MQCNASHICDRLFVVVDVPTSLSLSLTVCVCLVLYSVSCELSFDCIMQILLTAVVCRAVATVTVCGIASIGCYDKSSECGFTANGASSSAIIYSIWIWISVCLICDSQNWRLHTNNNVMITQRSSQWQNNSEKKNACNDPSAIVDNKSMCVQFVSLFMYISGTYLYSSSTSLITIARLRDARIRMRQRTRNADGATNTDRQKRKWITSIQQLAKLSICRPSWAIAHRTIIPYTITYIKLKTIRYCWEWMDG